ncbi:MAG TPA: prenyltransferase [Rhodocyclaceae bacterium]
MNTGTAAVMPVVAFAARAIRAPFLSVTAIALAIGFALAARDAVALPWLTIGVAALGALLAHAGANVLNDWADELNGSDRANEERISPFTGGSRLIQEAQVDAATTRRLAWSLLVAASLCGLALLPSLGAPLLAFGAAGLGLAWAYSSPPLQLMARGLGEIAVGLAWATVIAGADFVVRGAASPTPWLAGAGFALMIVALLWVNEFPDVAADRQAGKRNAVVRLGAYAATRAYPLLPLSAAGTTLLAIIAGALPAAAAIACAGLLPALAAARRLRQALGARGEARHATLTTAVKANLAAVHAYGILLAAALLLA